jgi:hypothetical protein
MSMAVRRFAKLEYLILNYVKTSEPPTLAAVCAIFLTRPYSSDSPQLLWIGKT